MESKKDIRKKIFAERKLHTDEQIEAMSRTITDKVTALPAFKNADRMESATVSGINGSGSSAVENAPPNVRPFT